MPRIRTIKPEFWSDALMAELDFMTRLFYIALWTYADDEGRGRAIAKALSGYVFPRDDHVDAAAVERALQELASRERIVLYKVGGERYYQVVRWKEHQSINRPSASHFPPPPVVLHDGSMSAPGEVGESSVPGIGNREQGTGIVGDGKGDGKGEGEMRAGGAAPFAPSAVPVPLPEEPAEEEVAAYFAEQGRTEYAARFLAHYRRTGWRRSGGEPVGDWKAAALAWIEREPRFRRRKAVGDGQAGRSVPAEQSNADFVEELVRAGLVDRSPLDEDGPA